MAGKRCPGERCPRILTQGERYCPQHAAEYEQRRGSPQARGYDAQHRAMRRAWQARIDMGETVRCARCGSLIVGTSWDLGHDDQRRHRGPECVSCNRSAGGRNGARARHG